MTGNDPRRAAQDGIRDRLIEAARRAEAAEGSTPRRRWYRRHGLALVLVGVLGAAGAASAAGLISTGDPIPDTRSASSQNRPEPGERQLAVRAADPDGELGWAASTYAADSGDACVIAGQVRGASLGLIRDNRFRPYQARQPGACGDLTRLKLVFDVIKTGGSNPRTVVFGRVQPGERTAILATQGREYTARTGNGGAFLFVFAGDIPIRDLRLRPGSTPAP